MLQSRHRRTRSTAPQKDNGSETSNATDSFGNIENGVIEWSKTDVRACSRLIPSLHQIFNRGSSFNGIASDSYGLLLSSDSAFIFPYTTASSTPPILTFPLPQGEESLLGALIPGPSNEPGLLVVMPTSGRIGFWPALHSALAPSSGIEARLALNSSEQVIKLCNAGAAGLVLATSSGRLVHLSLRDAAGKAIVHVTNMSGSSGWLGAIRSVTSRKEIVAIKAGAAQSREERQLHVITKRGGLTIWEIARGGNHRSILDTDLQPLLQSVDVTEVIDVVAYPIMANSILLLIRDMKGLVRVLGVRFDSQAQAEITHNISLPSLQDPQIQLPNPGHVAFVHTRSSVYLVTIADSSVDFLNFKNEQEIVAIGVEDQLKNKRNPGLVLLTKTAGVLRVEIFSSANGKIDSIKSRLEQAVFYGSLTSNPLDFNPPPRDADQETRELSTEILKGSSPFLQKSLHVAEMMHAKVRALSTLAEYVRKSVKSTTMLTLREHAEKAYAGEILWQSIDSKNGDASIISQLIPVDTNRASKHSQDVVRNFFLKNINRLPEVVLSAHKACIEAAAVLDSQPLAAVVLETNEIILSILMSATAYRKEQTVYGSGGHKWTSSQDILQSTTVQFDITRRLIAGLATGDGNELREQLVGLAALNCSLYTETIESALNPTGEIRTIAKTYSTLRPQWLKSLVDCGRTEKALEIGEKFRDFQTLIEICHDQGEKASDEDIINTVVRRLEWYLYTFEYDFATVLWEYYIHHRQFWNLLHEFPNHRKYLTQFFSTGKYPNIGWMNDVIIDDFTRAGEELLRIPEKRAEKQKIQLSIAKLALLVENEIVPPEVDNRLKFSNVMEQMVLNVRRISSDALDEASALDLASASIIAPNMRNRERSGIMRRYLLKLLRGEVLELGEAIDYLTTKSQPQFFEALQLLSLSKTPELSQEFFECLIWRRCLISNDWIKIADTRSLSDEAVEKETSETELFKTVAECFKHSLIPSIELLSPIKVHYHDANIEPISDLSKDTLESMKKEYELENELLTRYEELADLTSWHASTIQAVKASLAATDEDDDYVQVDINGHSDVMEE